MTQIKKTVEKKGNPNCPYCEGSGTKFVQNGADDYTKEECDCLLKKSHRRLCYGTDCDEDRCRCHDEEIKKEVEKEIANKRLADKLGMVYAGRNDEGEMEFIGTDKQWAEFNKSN